MATSTKAQKIIRANNASSTPLRAVAALNVRLRKATNGVAANTDLLVTVQQKRFDGGVMVYSVSLAELNRIYRSAQTLADFDEYFAYDFADRERVSVVFDRNT